MTRATRTALLVDLALVAIVAVCVWQLACYPEPKPGVLCRSPLGVTTVAPTLESCADLARAEADFIPVWLDAGLTQFWRLSGVEFVVHPDSDGGAWPVEEADGGVVDRYGDAAGCIFERVDAGLVIHDGPRRVFVASTDWKQRTPRLLYGHEGAHCLSQGMDDHPARGEPCADRYLFCRTNLDAKLSAAAKGL